MAAKNLCGRTKDLQHPYEIWRSEDGSHEWRVLKKYQADDLQPLARWKCAVRTPDTFGSWEHGDVYAADVTARASRIFVDPALDLFAGVRPELRGTTIDVPDPEQTLTTLYPERFPFLTQYFTEDGMSFHTTDAGAKLIFFFSIASEATAAILEAPWGMTYSQKGPHEIELTLAIFDQPDDPLRVPFFFDLKQPLDAHEGVCLVEQGLLPFYVLTLQDSSLGFVARRMAQIPGELRQELAPLITQMLASAA